MKNLLIYGATGGTSREVVNQALTKGYAVTAIVRDPVQFGLTHPMLTTKAGDVLEPSEHSRRSEHFSGQRTSSVLTILP